MTKSCKTKNCGRDATREVRASSIKRFKLGQDAPSRYFCEPCYHSWREGAKTSFANGVPQGEIINE